MPPLRALPLVTAALVSGCVTADPHPPVLDTSAYDLKRPGITCAPGLHTDEARGCTRPVNGDVGELRVRQRDEMSVAFQLVHTVYALDGHVIRIWNEEAAPPSPAPPLPIADPGASPKEPAPPPESPVATGPIDRPPAPVEIPSSAAHLVPRELPVFDVPVTPGPHVLQVLLRYRGNGYGVFSYLRGYKFHVRSSHHLDAAPGLNLVTVVGAEKSDPTTPLEERPRVEWRESKE